MCRDSRFRGRFIKLQISLSAVTCPRSQHTSPCAETRGAGRAPVGSERGTWDANTSPVGRPPCPGCPQIFTVLLEQNRWFYKYFTQRSIVHIGKK